jgi:hypothetical protein
MTDSERQLVDLYLDGVLPESEHALLFQRLETDPEALVYLASRTQLNVDLRRSFKRRKLQQTAVAGAATSMVRQPRSVWFSWRPLTAAAAGIIFGMFCTSLVFAYVAPSLGKAFPLLHEGFEHSPQLVHQAFPTAVGQWSVDTGDVVGPVRGASPKEGGHMLRLEPKADDKFTRAHYVVNLRQIPAFSRSGAHQAQFRVSFRPALVGKTDRYVLRAATFSGGLPQIEPEWMKGGWAEVQDRALSYAAQGGGVSKGTEDWITMTLSINVPAEANLMVLSLWAASMEEKREDRGAHYVDAVSLSFLTSEPLP